MPDEFDLEGYELDDDDPHAESGDESGEDEHGDDSGDGPGAGAAADSGSVNRTEIERTLQSIIDAGPGQMADLASETLVATRERWAKLDAEAASLASLEEAGDQIDFDNPAVQDAIRLRERLRNEQADARALEIYRKGLEAQPNVYTAETVAELVAAEKASREALRAWEQESDLLHQSEAYTGEMRTRALDAKSRRDIETQLMNEPGYWQKLVADAEADHRAALVGFLGGDE